MAPAKNLKEAVLLIDRGSRERTVQDELKVLSESVKKLGGYAIGEFAFLEVRGPTIEEGITKCSKLGAERIIAFPYFLHNGLKCRAAIERVRELSATSGCEVIAIDTPLGVDQLLVDIVLSRLRDLKATNPTVPEEDCEVLIIGHGSRYPEEKNDLRQIARSVKERSNYREVDFCFLELADPTISEGIERCLERSPKLLLIVPYFLHFGSHMQRDLPQELQRVSQRNPQSKVLLGKHLGTDIRLAELVVKRIRERLNQYQLTKNEKVSGSQK